MSYSVFVPHDQHVEFRWTSPQTVRADTEAALAATDWPDEATRQAAQLALEMGISMGEAGFAGPAFHLSVNGNLVDGKPEPGAFGGIGAMNLRFETRHDQVVVDRDAEVTLLRARVAALEAAGADQVGKG